MFLFNKKKAGPNIQELYAQRLHTEFQSYRDYDMSPFIDWINQTEDVTLLASASHILNTWGYPSFFPKCPFEFSKRLIYP